MKKIFVFVVCMMMAFAVIIPFEEQVFAGINKTIPDKVLPCDRVISVEPIDPVESDFVFVETLPQITNKLSISSLMGKITLENPEDPASPDAPQEIAYGFRIYFPSTNLYYDSNSWVENGTLSSVGEFPVFFKQPTKTTDISFENLVLSQAYTGKFYYAFYVIFEKDGENVYKFGCHDDDKAWFEFDLNKQPRPNKPKNQIVSSKEFSLPNKKFEVSYTKDGSTQLEWISAKLKVKGIQGEFNAYFDFYGCEAYDYSTKTDGGVYPITKDGTYAIGFTDDNDSEDLYGFDDFWEQAKKCEVYARCVVEDKDGKVVFRSKYYSIKQNPK